MVQGMNKVIVLLVSCGCISTSFTLSAADSARVSTDEITASDSILNTVSDLVNDGYQKLTGYQISSLMKHFEIRVVDRVTRAEMVSKKAEAVQGIQRKFHESKPENAHASLDASVLSRAPQLDGKIERKVVSDSLVVTNGVRTYHYNVYKKGNRFYAARDIDNGNVYFRLILGE